MRRLLVLLIVLVWSPAGATTAPFCALPGPGVIATVSSQFKSLPKSARPEKLAQLAPGGLPESQVAPAALAALPFVRHVAAAGAQGRP
jgi:hypothetical protein